MPRILPSCEVVTIPVAGGEGTVSFFIEAIGAEPVFVNVSGPYRESVGAVYARKDTLAIVTSIARDSPTALQT